MQLQSIRNATMRFVYHGHVIVCDPYLADKFSRPSFAGRSPNPLVDLPMSPADVIAGAECFLVSHLHSDHFDPAAAGLLPKSALIFCQPSDRAALEEKGFTRVVPVSDVTSWNGVRLRRTSGLHGSGSVLDDMGAASGFILSAPGEPSVFWAGDTILTDAIRELIIRLQPEVIITHSGGAVWGDEKTLIIMDAAQTVEVCELCPVSAVVAVHMEALDHGTVTRADLRTLADSRGIPADRLIIPQDGETIHLSKNPISA